jgi:hypothetical protein
VEGAVWFVQTLIAGSYAASSVWRATLTSCHQQMSMSALKLRRRRASSPFVTQKSQFIPLCGTLLKLGGSPLLAQRQASSTDRSYLGAVEIQVRPGRGRTALILVPRAIYRRTVWILSWRTRPEQA